MILERSWAGDVRNICGKLDLRLFLNNALNAHPTVQSAADAPTSTPIYAYTLRPRTFGLVGNWAIAVIVPTPVDSQPGVFVNVDPRFAEYLRLHGETFTVIG